MIEKILGMVAIGLMAGVAGIALAFVIALIMAIPVWLLWNWVAVTILGLKTITLLQALGLSILSSLLFKSSKS